MKKIALAETLSDDAHEAIDRLTNASYIGASDLFGIVLAEMGAIMTTMHSGPDVIGARQAGAGFGGCIVAFIESEQFQDFSEYTKRTYPDVTAIQLEVYGVQAAPGAGLLSSQFETETAGSRHQTNRNCGHERPAVDHHAIEGYTQATKILYGCFLLVK